MKFRIFGTILILVIVAAVFVLTNQTSTTNTQQNNAPSQPEVNSQFNFNIK